MLVSGFVTYELFSEWKAAQAVYLWLPRMLTDSLGSDAAAGWIKGLWMLLVVPAAVWSLLGVIVVWSRGAGTLGEAWRRLALPLAVVISAGHMAKGLAKFASWGGYLPMALADPAGVERALAITRGTITKPASLLPLAVISPIAVALIVVMACFAIRESRLSDRATHASRVLPILLVATCSALLALGWGLPP